MYACMVIIICLYIFSSFYSVSNFFNFFPFNLPPVVSNSASVIVNNKCHASVAPASHLMEDEDEEDDDEIHT